jgi:hypothetical protein
MSMTTFDGNENNDLYIDSSGNLVLIYDIEALADKLTQRLKLFYAEWFLATDRGVPYFDNIFGANKNKDIVASIFTNEILKESDVTSVVDVNYGLNSNTRKFSYSATINSIYGSTEFNFNG